MLIRHRVLCSFAIEYYATRTEGLQALLLSVSLVGRPRLVDAVPEVVDALAPDDLDKEGKEGTDEHLPDDQIQTNQNTKLGIFGWGAFASAQYKTPDDRLTATVGLRLDGCNYSSKMARFWENLSPTVSLSYRVLPQLAINAAAGFYHQLPPYTALGYTDASGGLANKSLKYMRVANINLGTEWNVSNNVVVSLEGFFKRYSHIPLSVTDGIPLACKGNDYGVVGNELLVSKADGRAYGVETCMRWQIAGKLTSVAS